MTRQVIFREAQEVQPADLNNAQNFITEMLDKLIADAVGAGQYFSGFAADQASTWVLSVAPGRRYADGLAYRNGDGREIDLFSDRPLSQRKVVALTAWGETIGTDVQDRDYEINAETGETIPKAVAMERLRRANLDTIVGSEAAQPQAPQIPPGNVVIALVTLSTGGIESIAMQEGNRTPQLARALEEIKDLRAFEADAKQSVQRLRTDLFSVAETIKALASKDALDALRDQLATTRDVADRALALGQGDLDLEFIEYFQSALHSDTEVEGYAARIDQGLKFPRREEVSENAISLLNPNDPKISIVEGVMTPVSSGKTALDNSQGFNGAASLLGYTTTTQTTKRVTKSS